MRGLLRVFGALLCMAVGVGTPAFAQDYNPNTGASTAPADGTLAAPASPNGVDWLNSMLGLSPSFLTSTGQVNGAYVNVDLSAYATKQALNAYVPLSGGTLAGSLRVGTGSGTFAGLYLNNPANVERAVIFQTAGVSMWHIGTDTSAISGSNAGADFWIQSYGDDGAVLGYVFRVPRATLVATFSHTPAFPSAAAGDNSAQGATTAFVRKEVASGFTVSSLPTGAQRYTGARAYVTDAVSCSFMAAPTGGGTNFCPVVYNGSTWVAD